MQQNFYRIFLLLVIILLAFLFRIFPAIDFVFSDNDVFLLGVDPYFYLRHVETAFQNFPYLQKFDHAAQFPNGITSDATGLYTLFLSILCKIFYGSYASTYQISTLMAWVAPLLSCLVYWLVYRLASKIKNNTAGLLSALILLLYPGLFLPRSLLGFPDHHIVEILLNIWLLTAFTSELYNIQVDTPSKQKYISKAILPFLLFFTVWSGAPLYIILMSLASYNYLVFFDGNDNQKKHLSLFFLRFFVMSGIILFGIQRIYPSIITLAFEHYAYLLSPLLVALGLVFYSLVYIKKALQKYMAPLWSILVLIISELGIAFLIINYTQIGKDVYSRLVFKTGLLQENMPVDFSNLVDMISIPGLLALLFSLKYLIQFFLQRSKYLHYLPTILFTAFFVFMWLSTYDMGYMLMPLISIVTGVFLYDVIYSTFSIYADKAFVKIPVTAFAILLLLFTIGKPLIFSSVRYPFIYSAAQIKPFFIYTPAWYESMDWMSINTPTLEVPTDRIVTSDQYHPTERQYGVLTSWDYGNIINQRGKRVPTWSRWPNNHAENALYNSTESFNPNLPCPNCSTQHPIKYIVVNDKMAADFFNIKFSDIHGSIDSCFVTTTLTNDSISFNASSLGECYEESLVYELYRGENIDTNLFELVWQSSQQKISGYFFDNNQLSLGSFNPNDIDKKTYENLESKKMASVNNVLMYNAYIGPEVKIYTIHF